MSDPFPGHHESQGDNEKILKELRFEVTDPIITIASMDREHILGKLNKIDVLPTFPGVVGEVIRVIEDPMSSATDLARSMDPSMAGEVLRVANTAYFGTRNFRKITSIEHAIAIVGFQHLSSIILQMPFVSMIGTDAAFDREEFIAHSMVCAILSKEVSSLMHTVDVNEVYISGLLHDIGTIVIYRYFHEEWEQIREMGATKGLSGLEAEKAVLSVDHGVIGALLLEMWNIPKTVTDGVMYHHDPEAASENMDSATAVALGNRFAKKIKLGDNLSSFDEFLNEYREFVDMVRDRGIDLRPGQEFKFFEHTFAQLKGAKGFLQGMREA